ncbi:DAK2 domain-containing protein [Brachybacterium hainanense]|uniref:DAK2 domain-containing protein n=1 Tax=Brachybacterium hainanense TaxID=1541174 RepID=A0ABV6R9R7_9MICO
MTDTDSTLARGTAAISALMTQNRDLLVRLDQVSGDGDLGISMDEGFQAFAAYVAEQDPARTDLAELFRQGAKVLNAAAPSSLGTILSFGLMGIARSLRGRGTVDAADVADAFDAGIANIMAKAGSKPGEKTVLDALVPAADALRAALDAGADLAGAARQAAAAAAEGSEATTRMMAVHGRAAYSAQRSIGVLDGGSVVGKLIVEGAAGAVG